MPAPFTFAMRVGVGLAVLDARDVARRGSGGRRVRRTTMSSNSATVCTRPRVRSVTDCGALVDAAAGDLDVLRLKRARHVGDRQVVGAQAIGVEPDVDLPLPAAEHEHLADAVDALELAPQHLVGVLGDVADRLVGA